MAERLETARPDGGREDGAVRRQHIPPGALEEFLETAGGDAFAMHSYLTLSGVRAY